MAGEEFLQLGLAILLVRPDASEYHDYKREQPHLGHRALCLGAGSCAPAGTGAAGAEAGSDAAAGGVVYCPASPMSYLREIWTQSYASVDVSDAQDYGGDTTVAG